MSSRGRGCWGSGGQEGSDGGGGEGQESCCIIDHGQLCTWLSVADALVYLKLYVTAACIVILLPHIVLNIEKGILNYRMKRT